MYIYNVYIWNMEYARETSMLPHKLLNSRAATEEQIRRLSRRIEMGPAKSRIYYAGCPKFIGYIVMYIIVH